MNTEEKISLDIKKSMLNGDKVRLSILRMLKSELSQLKEYDDGKVVKIAKKLSNSIEEVKGDNWEKEIDILKEFIPEQLSEDEMRVHVKSLINNGYDHIGKIMGYMNKNFSGLVDNGLLKEIVTNEINK